jgi:hypothetical protein
MAIGNGPSGAGRKAMAPRDDDHDDDRITKSLVGLAVILFLAVGALLLTDKLRVALSLQDCLMSGRTNCMSLDTSADER